MIAFGGGLALLVGGYFLYGRLTQNAIRPDPARVTPAVFMTVVTTTYILVEDVGFGLNPTLGTILGIAVGLAAAVFFLVMLPRLMPEEDQPVVPARPTDAERSADSLAC